MTLGRTGGQMTALSAHLPPSREVEARESSVSAVVRVEEAIEINRPVEDVFAYSTDVEDTPDWAGPVAEVRRESPALASPGDRFTLVQKFLGRKFESPCEVVELEPNRRFQYRSTGGPIPFTFTHSFAPSGAGTRFTMVSEGEPGSFFRLVGPLFEKAGRRQVKNDLETLKAIVESKQQ